ncbi:vesicular inhibitory amino acid transporter-like [Clytia hemisphaerica]|uniref:vesicular inhibitory amino acid transporter-like n=1 Tax=Clytia hemisphaerica TaxID=252671 RepID=UPI0034D65EDD
MWNAIWNLLPLLQGSSVFSMPYAVILGGYVTIGFIALMSVMGDLTSLILIDCLYDGKDPKTRQRVYKDYTGLAKAVLGQYGSHVFRGLLIIYLYLGNVSNMVLLSKCAFDILAKYCQISFTNVTIGCGLLAFPTLFCQRLKVIAYISAISVFSILIAIITLLVILSTQFNHWKDMVESIPIFNVEKFPVSASIVMFSCVSHSVLTKVEGELENPQDASKVVHVSFTVSAILKTIVGTLGALTFGPQTQSIITLNAGKLNQIVEIIFVVANIIFSVCNFPLMMVVITDTVDNIVKNRKHYQTSTLCRYTWFFITRLFLTIGTIILAFVLPYFGNLLALRGSLIATCLVFVFPCFFHLRLKWKTLTVLERILDIALIVIGTFLGTTGLYSSIYNLFEIVSKGHE